MPQWNTERLTIRRFRAEDADDLYDYLSKIEVVRFEPYPPASRAECEREALRRATDERFWAVCLKEEGTLIGNLTLSPDECGTWELGYVFNDRYQHRGYAWESARSLLDYAFATLGAWRVNAMCDPRNTPSWRLLERLGMRREGHLHKNVFFDRDESGQPLWKDTYLYAILREEWRM